MEATAKIDEMKEQKRLKTALMTQKMQLVFDKLQELEQHEQEVYVNGAAKSLRDHCVVTKASVKIKGALHERPED